MRAAWDAGIRYFDTAPWYGRGLSELRIGSGLRGRPKDEYILSTKIGRWLRAPKGGTFVRAPWTGGCEMEVVFDYSYDGLMRSYEQSQLRLGIPRYDIATIHDLDHLYHGDGTRLEWYFGQLAASGWRAIAELRASGLIRAVGAGINARGLIPRFLDLMDLDYFLVAMPYTLLHQEVLDDEFPAAVARGCTFIIGSPFQSGILATGPTPGREVQLRRRAGRGAWRRWRGSRTSASATASRSRRPRLQFPLGHPAVASVIPGASSPAQLERNVATFTHPIPADLWAELKQEGLIREDAPVPA